MLGRDGFAHRTGGGRIFDLPRFTLAEREPVRMASLGAEYVEAPRLGEAVVGGERRGVEQRLDLLPGDGAIGEPLDRAPFANSVGDMHALKIRPPLCGDAARVGTSYIPCTIKRGKNMLRITL